jgi:hypothetical protein
MRILETVLLDAFLSLLYVCIFLISPPPPSSVVRRSRVKMCSYWRSNTRLIDTKLADYIVKSHFQISAYKSNFRLKLITVSLDD